MFCREQAARVGSIIPELKKSGAQVVFIGNGLAWMAKGFDDEFHITEKGALLLTDPSRVTYRALGMKHGFFRTWSAKGIGPALKVLGGGQKQTSTKGDPNQQGGVVLVRKGGEIAFQHNDEFAGDLLDIEKLKSEVAKLG